MSYWEQLGPDVLYEIINYCDYTAIKQFSRLNRYFHKVLSGKKFIQVREKAKDKHVGIRLIELIAEMISTDASLVYYTNKLHVICCKNEFDEIIIASYDLIQSQIMYDNLQEFKLNLAEFNRFINSHMPVMTNFTIEYPLTYFADILNDSFEDVLKCSGVEFNTCKRVMIISNSEYYHTLQYFAHRYDISLTEDMTIAMLDCAINERIGEFTDDDVHKYSTIYNNNHIETIKCLILSINVNKVVESYR